MALRHDLWGALASVRAGLDMDRIGFPEGAGGAAGALAIFRVVRSIGFDAKLGIITQEIESICAPYCPVGPERAVCIFDDTEWDITGNNVFDSFEVSRDNEAAGEGFLKIIEFAGYAELATYLAASGQVLDIQFAEAIEVALEAALIERTMNSQPMWHGFGKLRSEAPSGHEMCANQSGSC